MLVLPVISILIEAGGSSSSTTLIPLIGKWFVFWAAGVRMFLAGIRQVLQPKFTAKEIFAIDDIESLPIVREVGFANLSIGFLGICSVFRGDWILPAAMVGGLYYGFAGLGHVFQKHRNAKKNLAMISDIFIFFLFAWVVFSSLRSRIS